MEEEELYVVLGPGAELREARAILHQCMARATMEDIVMRVAPWLLVGYIAQTITILLRFEERLDNNNIYIFW